MSKYINADDIGYFDVIIGGSEELFVTAKEDIDSMPAADVVEVVRCEDCKKRGDLFWCPLSSVMSVQDDWFCADGERKTE